MKKINIIIYIIFAFIKFDVCIEEFDENKKLLVSILINMDNDGPITSDQYNKYYENNNTIEGIKEIIKNNQFYINGFTIPGTESEFLNKTPEGYSINKRNWLIHNNEKYQVYFNGDFDNYDDAAFTTATGFIAGLECRLYDLNDDNFTDLIELDYVESFIVNEIIKNDDDTYTLYRSDLNNSLKWENDGREYDSNYFNKEWNESINKTNFDSRIKKGDIAIFTFRPEGWVIERGKEVKGMLVDGQDHEYYQINERKYGDAMRFSRDNIIISNRCGEYLNSHKYFGLYGYDKSYEVSLWFINSYDVNRFGAPCGFTSGNNSNNYLSKVIDICKNKLDSVLISEDGNNITQGAKYVNKLEYYKFKDAIKRAEDVANSDYPNDIYDYNVYLLYLASYGSQDDIGAQFAGYNYSGFDNQIKIKSNSFWVKLNLLNKLLLFIIFIICLS